ncbi:hypothetical protein [Mucilaginibacter sp. HD30]
MDIENNSASPPSFTSLTTIMEHFQTVPYDQFQEELQSWFERNLARQKGLRTAEEIKNSPDFITLEKLIGQIYHQAEVYQTLADNQITRAHDHQ